VSTFAEDINERSEDPLTGPCGVAIDQRNGDVYVSEWYRNKIKKISHSGWTTCGINLGSIPLQERVISSDTPGNLPCTVWSDIIAFCDLVSLSRLCQVCFAFYRPARRHIGGHVVTFAGTGNHGKIDGPAGEARFSYPCGMSFSEKHNCLFVTEYGSHAIRKIDITTGIVSTVAGIGKPGYLDGDGKVAQFDRPTDIALFDGETSLLVADCDNKRIRLIKFLDAEQVTVETFAGGGEGGQEGPALECELSSPHSLCIDHGNNTCYFTTSSDHKIWKLFLQ